MSSIKLMTRVHVLDLHPTQLAVGFQQVREKELKLKRLKSHEVLEFLKKKKVPVIKGPHGKLYLIDHHHLCKAAYNQDIHEVYVDEILDASHLPEIQFWDMMVKRKYIWLYNEHGDHVELPQFLELLPRDIRELRDDVYRSLAGVIRKQGAFKKVLIPFAEFQWANFLRTRLKGFNGLDDCVIKKAYILAKSKEARHLPGYCGSEGAM